MNGWEFEVVDICNDFSEFLVALWSRGSESAHGNNISVSARHYQDVQGFWVILSRILRIGCFIKPTFPRGMLHQKGHPSCSAHFWVPMFLLPLCGEQQTLAKFPQSIPGHIGLRWPQIASRWPSISFQLKCMVFDFHGWPLIAIRGYSWLSITIHGH